MRNRDEARVFELCDKHGLTPSWSTGTEDSSLHVDIWLSPIVGVDKVGIDVKGPRKYARQDTEFACGHTWLELRNRHGLRGSLFGHQKYIVIASPRGWLWLDRHELAIECVLRYIEHVGRSEPRRDWYAKSRGHSVIILAPFAYLYKVATDVWPDEQLQKRYNANPEQERHARTMGETTQSPRGTN